MKLDIERAMCGKGESAINKYKSLQGMSADEMYSLGFLTYVEYRVSHNIVFQVANERFFEENMQFMTRKEKWQHIRKMNFDEYELESFFEKMYAEIETKERWAREDFESDIKILDKVEMEMEIDLEIDSDGETDQEILEEMQKDHEEEKKKILEGLNQKLRKLELLKKELRDIQMDMQEWYARHQTREF